MVGNTSWGFPDMTKIVPPGGDGRVSIRHVEVSELESSRRDMQANVLGSIDEYEAPGTYVKLFIDGDIWMDDGFMERHTHAEVLSKAHGSVLIGGLGIGMVACGILQSPDVTHVTILESNQQVVDLVAPHVLAFSSKPCQIILADVFSYETDSVYDVIWMDIWRTRSTDNLIQMAYLNEAYRLNPDNLSAFRGCWYERELHAVLAKQKECLAKIATDLDLPEDLLFGLLAENRELLDSLVSRRSGKSKVLAFEDDGFIDLVDLGQKDQASVISALFGYTDQAAHRRQELVRVQLEEVRQKATRLGFDRIF